MKGLVAEIGLEMLRKGIEERRGEIWEGMVGGDMGMIILLDLNRLHRPERQRRNMALFISPDLMVVDEENERERD
jgi:hypothetical protein